MASAAVAAKLDPLWYAQLKFSQHKYEECIAMCTELLEQNPYDQV